MIKTLKNDFRFVVCAPGEALPGRKNEAVFKFSYVLPYEQFGEIRNMQIAVRKAMLKGCFTLELAIDVSEWIGHETEEYFEIMMKYLHDHRDKFDYLFISECENEKKIEKMYRVMRTYMRGRIENGTVWSDAEKAASHIGNMFGVSKEAAAILCRLLSGKEMEKNRNDAFIKMVTEEIRDSSVCETIGVSELISYLSLEDSTLRILLSGENGDIGAIKELTNTK